MKAFRFVKVLLEVIGALGLAVVSWLWWIGAFDDKVQVREVVRQLCAATPNASLVVVEGVYPRGYACARFDRRLHGRPPMGPSDWVPVSSLNGFCKEIGTNMRLIDGWLICK